MDKLHETTPDPMLLALLRKCVFIQRLVWQIPAALTSNVRITTSYS